MNLRTLARNLFLVMIITTVFWELAADRAIGAGREASVPDLQFQPAQPTKAVSLRESVDTAVRNYPTIRQKFFKLRAAKANVSLAKMQYLPNLNIDTQISGVTPNRIASVVMNNVSGFDTVPVDSGPSASRAKFGPIANNLQGMNLNWLMVDFGLRKANDRFAAADARTARADISLTELDVAFATADSFFHAAAAKQVITARQASLDHMEAAKLRVKTLVAEGLRPGVDAADLDYEVAKAKINLVKAEKDFRLALVDLAEKMGLATHDFDIISDPVVRSPMDLREERPIDLSSHPLARFKFAEIERWRAKQTVLDKAYRPHLWLNSSIWGRGSGDNAANPIKNHTGGVLPQVFNYMVGASFSFPILEYFPLKAQKQMARSNELAARADFDVAMLVLEKKDANSRVLIEQTRKVAKLTPELVAAARVKEINVLKRYTVGLNNVVSLAVAEENLATADVENAVAQIEVWRSILALGYAQGDLQSFFKLVKIAEGETTNDGS
ncbi:MAG: TolC family protein [Candidatus Melainabacteria bacterium]|nr:TolC family protein [Candidatus Melainabacteria bacterium]